MITLRVIIDQVLAPVPGGIGRYAEELTRALIATAPPGTQVEGFVSSSPQADYDRLEELLPGLAGLVKSPFARRELSAAWQHGFTRLGSPSMVHAMSVLAPLSKHDRVHHQGNQTVVTVHDVVPWTHPETLTPHGVSFHKTMVKRAHKYADAIVVPTHAVSDELQGIMDFSDRIRVIGGAVSSRLALPADADARAAALGLPAQYVLAVGTLEPRKGLDSLITAMGLPGAPDIPLLIAGPAGWGNVEVSALAAEAGLSEGHVRTLGHLSDEDLAVVLERATVFVFPSRAEGFGLPVIEAFSLGTPVVHADVPAVVEVAAGAGIVVELDDPEGYPGRLAEAIGSVVGDAELAERLRYSGMDRAKAFSWHSSAEKVWQLHADL